MASGDGAHPLDLGREQRLAAEVVRRYGLAPPVNVWAVAEEFASVETDYIPGECDGVVVGLYGPGKPRIVVSSEQVEVRQRFTLGHELGHVVLGWHLGGSYLCDTAKAFPGDARFRALVEEQEANRFAAELLVPSAWLQQQIEGRNDETVAPLMQALREAQVSSYVACFRLLDFLPRGHAFALLDPSGRVEVSGQTRGTGIFPPPRGQALNRERLDRFAETVEEVRFGSKRLVWWTFRGVAAPVEVTSDPRTSRELLSDLLERHATDADDARRIQRSFAGIIGAANGEARREGAARPEELHVRFRSRFARERDLPGSLLEDPDFDAWLAKRAAELGEE